MDYAFILSLANLILFSPVFLASLFFAFYVPGTVMVGKLAHQIYPKYLLGRITVRILLGMVFFSLQGVVFGYLNIRFLTPAYILFFLILYFKENKLNFYPVNFSFRKNLIFILIFAFGVINQTQQFVITGLRFHNGIYTLTPTFDDAFWHTGLIESLTRNFPPIEPGLSGIVVHNYHYWWNLMAAELIRVFHLPILQTQYVYLYVFLSVMIGVCALSVGELFKLSRFTKVIFVYLQYFSSDIIYLISFISTGKFVFTVHPLQDGSMFLENPPRAVSYLVTFTGIILLHNFLKTKDKRSAILSAIVFGTVIGFKVHTGFLVLSGELLLLFYFLAVRKYKLLYQPIIAFLISAVIYIPSNIGAGSAVFAPFIMSRMFSVQEGLGLVHLDQARQIYESHKNILGQLRFDFSMVLIFLLGQFGITNFGWYVSKSILKISTLPLFIFLYGSTILMMLLGFLFLQPVAGADIFNSFLAANFFLTILTAFFVQIRIKSTLLVRIFVVVMLVATLPRFVYRISTIRQYFHLTTPVFKTQELEAMDQLRKSTDKKDITIVFNKGLWDSHYSYVSVFAGQNTFLSGRVISGRHGINSDRRQIIVDEIKESSNASIVKSLLDKNGITFLYFYDNDKMKIDPVKLGYILFYKNDSNTIFKKK